MLGFILPRSVVLAFLAQAAFDVFVKKVELSKRVKQKFSGNLDTVIEKKWIKLFEALRST